jgi:hypothetical protein
MKRELVITPSPQGWRVADASGRIPPSLYPAVDEAKREARHYLVHHGGGQLTVCEGPVIVWKATIVPEQDDGAERRAARAPRSSRAAGWP